VGEGFRNHDVSNNVSHNPRPSTSFGEDARSAGESIITLPSTAEKLEFQYTATCLTAAERVKFKYILEGYDKDWVEAGNRRTAYYNNLPRGRNYRFRVIACNNDGVWNETGAWAEFRITPYWWETWWFYGLCVMVVVGTSYQGFCWRTRRLRAKAQELERLVDVRTKEVQEQAREIQLANTELSEKNLELSIALHQLQTTQAQLVHTEKMAGLGQVTAGVAHEINNPVSFIAAALPMLKEDLESVFDVLRAAITLSPQSTGEEFSRWEALKRERDLDALLPEIYEFLDSMKIGAERIAEIVRSLRTFSRLDEDVLKLANLHDGLDSTLVILRNQYRERIRIEKHYQADLPAVQCYPGQINQVFINVLANAVQAIKGQGVITITTHVVDALVEIRISDTGAGMSAEVQARAFEPFYTTKDVGKGTGLGLSISFGIVEQHHGTIRLDSVLGEGTTVEIRLPLNQPKRRC
jgi:signal transduction histidine kinase